jgi:SAM-dependent methyltransferase
MPSPTTLEQIRRESEKRLHPSLRNPNWLILRRRRQILEGGLTRLPQEKITVLDVGGRLQPYRALLGAWVANYIAIDPIVTPLVNVAANGEAIPFRDEQFDFAICTQVLEYCAEPREVALEIWRVLRRGGVAFISAPSIFVRDHDDEYWRFLPAGLRHVLRDFEEVEVVAEGNSITGFFRTINVFLVSFVKPRFLVPIMQWSVVPILNLAGYVLEGLGGNNDLFSANYSVWVRK